MVASSSFFAAQDFLLLDPDLDHLLLQLVGHVGVGLALVGDALLLGDRLVGLVAGDFRGPLGVGIGLLLAAELVGVGLGDRGVAFGFGFLGHPLRRGLPFAGFPLGVGGSDRGFHGGDRLGDGGGFFTSAIRGLPSASRYWCLSRMSRMVKESMPRPMLARSPAEISCTFWANWSRFL